MRRWRYLAIKVLLLLPVLLLSATALWTRAGGAGGGGGGDSGGDDFAGDIIGAIFGLILELAVDYPPFGIALVITIVIFWLIIRYYNKKPN